MPPYLWVKKFAEGRKASRASRKKIPPPPSPKAKGLDPPLKAFRPLLRGGRNRIGRREKWPKKSWEEGEIGGKSREEGEKET